MARHFYNCGNLTIAQSATASNSMDGYGKFHRATGLIIAAPATLTGALTLQDSDDASVWRATQSGGTDINVTQGETVIIDVIPSRYIRVVSAATEAAARTIGVKAFEDLN